VLSIEFWGHRMSNRSILFNCDNEALVYVLNKQSSLEPKVMILIRKLVLLTLQYNILFKTCHFPGKENVLSDSFTITDCQIQSHETRCNEPPNSYSSSHVIDKLKNTVGDLVDGSLARSTRLMYGRVGRIYFIL